jgi:hypothetical protein
MEVTETPIATPAPPSAGAAQPQVLPQFAKPNLYELTGGDIDVTFLPMGLGGKPHLTYQDAQRTLQFTGDQIRIVALPDLGSVVSVTLVLTPDSGSTTFSVILPDVNLDNQRGSFAHVHTDAITTQHRFSLIPQLLRGQLERYHVTRLTGTASLAILPL